MSAGDGLLILVRSGAVLATAGLVMLLARRNPALRVAASRFGLLGALIVSLATPWIGERARPVVAVPDALPPVVFTVAPKAVRVRVGHAPVRGVPTPMPPAMASSPRPVELPLDPLALVLPLWAAGSLALGVQLLFGIAALARTRQGCGPASPDLTARVGVLAEEMGIAAPKVFEGPNVAGLCVAGVRRASVLLPPRWAERTAPDVVDAVLRHELSHVANGDLRWGLFARLARILLWPQPLVWLLRRPTAAAEEEACDRQVLASGISQSRYAAGLMELREGRGARTPGLAIGAVSRRSDFGRRIEAILDFRGRGGVRLSRRSMLAVRGGALVLALGAAFAFARPNSASLAQSTYPTAGWIRAPYAGSIQLVDVVGKPIPGAKAWIAVSGRDNVVREQKVEGSAIRLEPFAIQEDTIGVLAVRAPGYGLTLARLWPAPKRVAEIHPYPAASLKGRLLLPDGRPAAGVRVTTPMLVAGGSASPGPVFLQAADVHGLTPTAVTDATGFFRMDGFAPQIDVQFDVDDPRFARLNYADRKMMQTITAKPSPGPVTRSIEAKPIRLRLAGRVAGRVTRDGRPLAGLKIGAQTNTAKGLWNGSEWGEAVTDADGRYAIERLGATAYNVAPDLRGGLDREVTARAREAVEVKEGATVGGVDFELVPGGLVEGTVTLPNGKPLPNTEVGVYGPAHPDSSAWVQSTRTDTSGYYRLRVPAGAQRVYLMDSRYEVAEQRITTRDGETRRFDLHVTGIKPSEVAQGGLGSPQAPAPPEPENAPTGAKASFGPGKPFYGPVRLPNGETVRLAFVQDGSKGNPIWSPDGGPARAADRKGALDLRGFGTERPTQKWRRIFLRVDVTGPASRGDTYAVVAVPHPSSFTVWQTYGDPYGHSLDLAGFRANKELKVTDMRFGLAAGPYHTVSSGRPGQGPLFAQVMDGNVEPPATLSGETSATVTVRFPASLEGKDVRLAVFTKDGRKLALGSWQNDTQRGKGGVRTRTYGFNGAKAEAIEHVELQARPYWWATFKGIHLYPGGR